MGRNIGVRYVFTRPKTSGRESCDVGGVSLVLITSVFPITHYHSILFYDVYMAYLSCLITRSLLIFYFSMLCPKNYNIALQIRIGLFFSSETESKLRINTPVYRDLNESANIIFFLIQRVFFWREIFMFRV